MTAGEVLKAAQNASLDTVSAHPDVKTFEAYAMDEVLAAVRSATACEGVGPSFVLTTPEFRIALLADADGMTVTSVGKRR